MEMTRLQLWHIWTDFVPCTEGHVNNTCTQLWWCSSFLCWPSWTCLLENYKPCYALSIIIIIYHNPAIYSHSPQLRMKNNLRRTDIQAASKSPSLPMPTLPCNKWCVRYACFPAAAATLPWWMWRILRRPWPIEEGRRELCGDELKQCSAG